MIEADVHSCLLAFLREQGHPHWHHHLTMGRLVARALRLGRSALIQTAAKSDTYALSYLIPALMWPKGTVLVTPPTQQVKWLEQTIPQLLSWLGVEKKVIREDHLPTDPTFSGLCLISPQHWLNQDPSAPAFPTLIDPVDDWETWTREHLTLHLHSNHWQELSAAYQADHSLIEQIYQQLGETLFKHPSNPYQCYCLDPSEQELLIPLWQTLPPGDLPPLWQQFKDQSQQPGYLIWTTLNRGQQTFSLHLAPIDVAAYLHPLWQKQPVVLMGAFLDSHPQAPTYRQRLGLEDLTCLKFSANRQTEHIQLYLPDRLPMPNTPEFQKVLIPQLHRLCRGGMVEQSLKYGLDGLRRVQRPVVILVDDVPLKAQVGATLAAEYGSLVQVETTQMQPDGILVAGWSFWHQYHDLLPTPELLVIATLPFPSVEHPLVAGQVNYYKQQRQDWFREYLLPTALRELQWAVLPVRESQGVVALLDNRVNYRSYGGQVLGALEPFARINYLST
ncbi:hypothetical protein K4A83_13385 [Spirulina subsalsa FACHB-351]|uniref:ATP-dependent helicase C-terminal domain-containing protein n=1 Tax=Spirulina subsalsa FACHB-351 TaxID=234711 RepID=A0ABT3L8H3_9CYAN|nr:helicase C-terminal domain-containing protein [Spirulina subsalsa]MCW6037255.1 hypothetical protein [Spirulina subsalsa FACHB-351]